MNRKGVFHMAKKTKTQPKARKTITSNNLADLSKLVQALEIDDENPENQQKPSALDKKIIYNEFQNSTYTLVSPMAYLIGIDKENFGEENARQFLLKSYEKTGCAQRGAHYSQSVPHSHGDGTQLSSHCE